MDPAGRAKSGVKDRPIGLLNGPARSERSAWDRQLGRGRFMSENLERSGFSASSISAVRDEAYPALRR